MVDISKAVIMKDGMYLLIKHSMNTLSYPGLWDFPGGKVKSGEKPDQTAVRSVYEETSFEIEPGSEVANEQYHDEFNDYVYHYFLPSVFSGEIGLSSEYTDCLWVKAKNIWDYNVTPSVLLYFTKRN